MMSMLKMRMKLFKNQKGLTLVELLAVIVILGVIAAIAIPAIGSTIENARNNADVQSANMLEEAALLWANTANPTGLAGGTPAAGTITVAQLQGTGYIREEVTTSDGGAFTITLTFTAGTGWTAAVTY